MAINSTVQIQMDSTIKTRVEGHTASRDFVCGGRLDVCKA